MYLNCHTFHSLRYGTLSVKNLVESAARAGVDTLCLTDINTTTAIYEFLQACRGAGIKPIVGMEFRVGGSYYILYWRKVQTHLQRSISC